MQGDTGTSPRVALHLLRLEGDEEAAAALLDAAECARAAAFRRPDDRRRFVLAHAALRRALARATGRDPASLAIARTPEGQPILADGPWFSLSHAGEFAAIAIAHIPVGIDIEPDRPLADAAAMARLTMAPPEAAAFDGGARHFLQCWTRKEAVLKAAGIGLLIDARTVDAGFNGLRTLELGGRSWTVGSCPPAPGLHAAVAVAGTVAAACGPWITEPA